MFRAFEFKPDRLINRNGHGLSRRIAVVAGVNGDGLSFHACTFGDIGLILLIRSYDPEAAPAFSRCSGTLISRSSCWRATETDARPRTNDFPTARVRVRAAKPAPKANRITGPKLL